MGNHDDKLPCSADPDDVAVCHHAAICTYADSEGRLARGGRDALRAFLIAEPEPADSDGHGCGCRRCTGVERPMSDDEADAVLAHLPPRVATLYELGKVDFRGCAECEQCGRMAPLFTDSMTSQPGVLAQRRCGRESRRAAHGRRIAVRVTLQCCSDSGGAAAGLSGVIPAKGVSQTLLK
ncbi:hypothetical protein [Mycobacterium palustre]|uniref:hypothetical protein n=1 Tax=Mycobacterium palustre TaxID=153971 RepID=UPI0011519148|nr:hypothetical protein [Mycobacterium palustre]MCV7101151.1 hypothetical protein [Mycobacterium palustre]